MCSNSMYLPPSPASPRRLSRPRPADCPQSAQWRGRASSSWRGCCPRRRGCGVGCWGWRCGRPAPPCPTGRAAQHNTHHWPQPTATDRNRPQPTATYRNRPQPTATDRQWPQLTTTDRRLHNTTPTRAWSIPEVLSYIPKKITSRGLEN